MREANNRHERPDRLKGWGNSEAAPDRGGYPGGARPAPSHFRQVLTMILIMVPVYVVLILGKPALGVKIGQSAPRDFYARATFQVVDLEGTEFARDQARRQAPLVFRATQEKFSKSRDDLLAALEAGQQGPLWARIEDASVRGELVAALAALRRNKDKIQQTLDKLGQMALLAPGDIRGRALQPNVPAVILGPEDHPQRTVPESELALLDAEAIQLQLIFEESLAVVSKEKRQAVLRGIVSLLSPTVELDREETRQRADDAGRTQKPVVKKVRKGSLILARDAEVRKQHILELRAEREEFARSPEGRRLYRQGMLGLGVVLLVLAGIGGFYIARYRAELMRSKLQRFAFTLVTLMLVGVARLFAVLDIPTLLVPLPLVVMVLCLVYDQRLGFAMAALYAVLVSLASGTPSMDFVVLMLGAMMAALLTQRVRTRSALIQAGVFTGLGLWAAAWGVGILTFRGQTLPSPLWESAIFKDSIYALCNGLASGFLVSGLLPAIEHLFGVTTDIRLLEWSNPNQPLLQRLLVEAPGTYHHSMVVANLAADAAESIGANPLLARVSAYFHDIGKLKKPEYFGENVQRDHKSPHEDLSPVMSRLIITAHPRDGADLAEQQGLPKEVRDIILESHGSTTVKYFWDRAQQQGDEDNQLEESTFRYRLPKPHSKEAACVMLSDAAESAARSLASPSTGRFPEMVHELVMDRLLDGQLNESGLTLTDLQHIEKVLTRGLSAVYHKRVAYPGQEDKEPPKEEDEEAADSGGQPAE